MQGSPIQNLVVGLVFLGGLALLGFASLTVRGIHLTEAAPIQIRFPTVENLRTGENVVIYGHTVGEVNEIRFAPTDTGEGNILVTCSVNKDVELTDQTVFRIRNTGPLGGKFIEIVPKTGDTKTFEWTGFKGEAEPDIFTSLNELVSEVRGEGVPPEDAGLLPRLIQDQRLARKAEETIDEFRKTFEHINQGLEASTGLLPRLMNDEGLANKVDQIADEILATMQRVNKEDGVLSDLEAALEDVQSLAKQVSEGEGMAAYFISSAEGRKRVESILEKTEAAVENLKPLEGSLVQLLLGDTKLAGRFQSIAESLDEVIIKANSGDGTLAQIINNRDAWDEFLRVLVLARESIEDLREQAPISTFANVLFSAF